MTKVEIIEYEIWRKTLPMTLRNALAPSDLANMFNEDQKQALNIADVSKQRELLIAFAMWEIKEPEYQIEVELVVDAYIKEKGNL